MELTTKKIERLFRAQLVLWTIEREIQKSLTYLSIAWAAYIFDNKKH